MPGTRRYDDPCGIARALDVVGDRWALLVVRELVLGPKRFAQLRAGLPGISPNVLSQRLRELEDAGLLTRSVLDRPAAVTVYELTARGRALEPILLELGRWGRHEPIATETGLGVDAFLIALKTVYVPAAIDATYALVIDGEWYRVSVAGPVIDVVRARTDSADAVLEAGIATMRAVAFGRESIVAAERAGRLTVRGRRRAAQRFTQLFRGSTPVA